MMHFSTALISVDETLLLCLAGSVQWNVDKVSAQPGTTSSPTEDGELAKRATAHELITLLSDI